MQQFPYAHLLIFVFFHLEVFGVCRFRTWDLFRLHYSYFTHAMRSLRSVSKHKYVYVHGMEFFLDFYLIRAWNNPAVGAQRIVYFAAHARSGNTHAQFAAILCVHVDHVGALRLRKGKGCAGIVNWDNRVGRRTLRDVPVFWLESFASQNF